ncbi:GNAT family N-acetyltransferase [Hyunsoonleella flava]|uniref:GNAT family N-acetyltransferase n=1 Tax=Hyunsoonleella flava TaxID=2527939 RepID=A0A4Q9FI78_9FLAO|nr:GNAT family N-acetyltransferase [Hyunsoonleella flava]TBN05523.1 GNAT family N-acetyltransferase [Hyunsoonleella flava]
MDLKKEYQVKQILTKDTYPVRHPVLRSGRPVATCAFGGDDLSSTIHLGLFNEDNIIGVASFMQSKHELFSEKSQYQLRGMAILKPFQGKGLGEIILSHGETLLKEQSIDLIWCNARIIAVNFYKRRGYKTKGTPFDIPNIGQHYIMYKVLT